MKTLHVFASATIALGLVLAGCGADKTAAPATTTTAAADQAQTKQEKSPADYTKGVQDLVAELNKGKDGGKVDWAKATKLYTDEVKPLVAARDAESNDTISDQIEAALKAGQDGKFTALTVAQLTEKLSQKVFFLSLRHDFKEANEKFKDTKVAKDELAEGRAYFDGLLKSFVEKRDTAYGTQLVAAITGAFDGMNKAVDAGNNLEYNLSKQVADKSLMKAFYLASGAGKGYGYKVEKLAADASTKEDVKAAQAEGWAFFQSLKTYLEGPDKADADLINSKFDLATDAKSIKGDEINKAYVRAFALTAQDEYKQMFANWGKDKASITALEGALFLSVVETDLPKALGEEAAKSVLTNAQALLDAVKAGNKDLATELHGKVNVELDKLAKYGK
ncbi:hypothetical protein [Tumebacillus permanentifrigoris]|uniref:Lipoprotein n=1 Tax=Tumebacillus permanentifrigoris TaxID=378543 RepID=A0A316DA47_9BACL|nr:hypothetical protein [Tumebacillus permanentifrigoris]PWK13371.1 hypothetical protein C7459_10737 [Tumebacillus permanentifrigoris]